MSYSIHIYFYIKVELYIKQNDSIYNKNKTLIINIFCLHNTITKLVLKNSLPFLEIICFLQLNFVFKEINFYIVFKLSIKLIKLKMLLIL